MAAHFRFVRDHQKHIKRIALVTGSALGNVAEHLAAHFVSAQIKHFPAGHVEAATQWVATGE
jgi:purine nucleoside phosphorylase